MTSYSTLVMKFGGKMICSSSNATTTETWVNVLVARARQFVRCSGKGSSRAPMGFSPISFCHASGFRGGAGGRKRISKFPGANGVTMLLIWDNPGLESRVEKQKSHCSHV